MSFARVRWVGEAVQRGCIEFLVGSAVRCVVGLAQRRRESSEWSGCVHGLFTCSIAVSRRIPRLLLQPPPMKPLSDSRYEAAGLSFRSEGRLPGLPCDTSAPYRHDLSEKFWADYDLLKSTSDEFLAN